MRQVVKRIFPHSKANLTNSLSLVRKALYWRNRAELTTTSINGNNKGPMSGMSEVRESSSSRTKKSNFFAQQIETETEDSISTPSHTPTN